MQRYRSLVLMCVVMFMCTACAMAEQQYVFPADARIVDVTAEPWNADPTGERDSTAAIQAALDRYPSGNRIIYLPNGVYKVTDTLKWPAGKNEAGFMKRTILQGQSTSGAIIRVPDETPGFTDPDQPRCVIITGRAPAQRFRNSIRTLTVDTGSGNLGAIGIRYNANNQGTVRDVTIRSGDGTGVAGLDLAVAEQGPALIRGVKVFGFDIGIRNGHIVNSITMEHIHVEGQLKYGITNHHQIVTIRGLTSRNTVPAVRNRGGGAMFTLVEAELTGLDGASEVPAIINKSGFMVARDIKTTGYKMAIDNRAGHGNDIKQADTDLFISHWTHTLFGTTGNRTLRLPIKETPSVPWDDVNTWTGPHQFGGQAKKGFDNTEALQKAIDSGATTIYLPNGRWVINGEVIVRGNVRRIIGCETSINGKGTLRIADGTHPIVRIERIDMIYNKVTFHHNTRRTLVLSSITFHGDTLKTDDGAGDLFMEDICINAVHFTNQNVWARQLNPENKRTKIVNDGGNLWILGLKTEQQGTAVETINGGKTEILGYFCYANCGHEKPPLFKVIDSSLSVNMAEMVIRKQPFRTLVTEIQEGETRTLTIDDTPGRGGGSAIPMFYTAPD